ncbi:MAG: WxL domain-containing protein [Actinomycetota bacterium]
MRTSSSSVKRFVGATCGCVLATTALCSPAFGSSANQTVHSGPISLTTSSISLPDTTLTGAIQTVTASAGSQWVATDARGTGAGWSVTIAGSSDLTSPAGSIETTARTIALANLVFTPGSLTSLPGSDDTGNLSSNAVTLSTSSQTFLTCNSNCKGRYGFTPSVSLTVPANAFRSNYSGAVNASSLNPYGVTLTLTIA